ncbi:MAG: hypothetical protein M3036_09830, partial [Bifidobacteriales bacterium]|nr:hypothetical protein [Bifidobacteriales bacterium]
HAAYALGQASNTPQVREAIHMPTTIMRHAPATCYGHFSTSIWNKAAPQNPAYKIKISGQTGENS